MIKKIFLLFFFITACGYQPLYLNKSEIKFNEIIVLGDKQVNRKIISSLALKKDQSNTFKNEIIFDSKIEIKVTSKDSKGKPATFKTNLDVKVTIKENNKIVKEKIFTENFNYSNIENKYNLSSYQSDVEKNLINKLVEDIIIFINL